MTFVNLHRHSQWSLLDGSGSGEQYAKRAVELGQHALALTDHGTLAGALEHVAACKDSGIMPIMGVEAYFRDNRLDHSPIKVTNDDGKEVSKAPPRYHLTLLAMNFNGWLNLSRLTSEAYATGFYYKPCIDWDILARYSQDIYCLGGCIGGRLSKLIQTGYEPDVINYISRMRSIFGDRFSLEIMPHDFDDQRVLNLNTLRVANEHGIPLAATGDTHYPFKDWSDTQDVMLMLSTGQTNEKRKRKREAGEDIYSMLKDNPTLYLMGEEDIMLAFAQYHPMLPADVVDKAIRHTGEIISGFTPFLMGRGIKMPTITRRIISKIDNWTDEKTAIVENSIGNLDEGDEDLVKTTLRRWAAEGLEEIKQLYPATHWFKHSITKYESQIEHEFDIFEKVGDHVWRYMIMVAGEIRYARSQEIVVGPGRGSAAGSLVAYLIGITDIDPIAYGLMFERFINENRKGMPDIDIDFMPGARGRDKVQAHTALIYDEPNSKNVINIAAYGTYGPKSALRAVCRVFDDLIDYVTADRYVKVLDALKPTDKIDLEECSERFSEIAEFKQRYPKLWIQAIRIEGHPYTQSVHASGVLVKPSNIEVPTAIKIDKETQERSIVTAWPDTRELLANYGFLKIDYLVIDGLVRQFDVMKALRERENTIVDLRTLPVRWDPFAVEEEIMEIFQKGMTLGIWQFEGRGTVPVLKAVKPENMHDLAAINALIRPGSRAAGDTEMYAKIKHGIEPLTYWHDAVEPALKNTYGLMVYQEQVMEVAVQLGGFTRTEADDLRKAMGKKYREGMAAVKKFLDELGFGPKFINKASTMVGEENALMIWDKTLAKGGYSFNACVSGDTVVCRGGAGRNAESPEITIKDLYDAQESRTPWGQKLRAGKLKLTHMEEDGQVRLGQFKKIVCNGLKPVYQINTWGGKSIKVTANHRLLTSDGYLRVDQMTVGTKLVVQGKREPYENQRRNGRGRGHVVGQSYEGQGFQDASANPSWLDGRTEALYEGRLKAIDCAHNKCVECHREGDVSDHSLEVAHRQTLEQCGGSYLKFHDASNLQVLCNSCHKKLDYIKGERKKRWTRGVPTIVDMISCITYAGEEIVYDIEMNTHEHNFIANGIVSHNSHAYAYALISYHDGKFKHMAPGDFYAGMLSNTKAKDMPMRLAGSMREGARFGIKILPPDINRSMTGFTVTDRHTILYGLEAVKGLGPAGVKEVIANRPYRGYADFDGKVPRKTCNKNARKALAGAGAFDAFGMRSMMSPPEMALNEEAYIGVKLSGKSDLETYAELVEATIHTEEEFDDALNGASLCVGGEVVGVKQVFTKKGDPMGFVTCAYGIDTYRITCFPPVWSIFSTMFVTGKVLFFEGVKDVSDQYGAGFIAKECIDLADLAARRI